MRNSHADAKASRPDAEDRSISSLAAVSIALQRFIEPHTIAVTTLSPAHADSVM